MASWRIPIFQEHGRKSGTIRYAQEASKTQVLDVVKMMGRQDSNNGESGQKLMYYEVKYFYGAFMSPQEKIVASIMGLGIWIYYSLLLNVVQYSISSQSYRICPRMVLFYEMHGHSD